MKMLEHQKMVLTHVSKDKNLFRKELFKSFTWLDGGEQALLMQWLRNNFNDMYEELVSNPTPAFKIK